MVWTGKLSSGTPKIRGGQKGMWIYELTPKNRGFKTREQISKDGAKGRRVIQIRDRYYLF
jgi:hypothetical protein